MAPHPLAWGQTCMLAVSPPGTDATFLHDHPPEEQPTEQKQGKKERKFQRIDLEQPVEMASNSQIHNFTQHYIFCTPEISNVCQHRASMTHFGSELGGHQDQATSPASLYPALAWSREPHVPGCSTVHRKFSLCQSPGRLSATWHRQSPLLLNATKPQH